MRASVAGLLMCHDRPDDYIYNSFIQAVYYRGTGKWTRIIRSMPKDFRGPLDQQILDAYKFVQKHTIR